MFFDETNTMGVDYLAQSQWYLEQARNQSRVLRNVWGFYDPEAEANAERVLTGGGDLTAVGQASASGVRYGTQLGTPPPNSNPGSPKPSGTDWAKEFETWFQVNKTVVILGAVALVLVLKK